MSGNLDKVSAKILVLGDSGVGKSSLIHLICHSTAFSSSQWTIGCSIDVKLHGNCYLEFWDIGGSRSHKIARSFLYQDYHGIILVFDATNKKSRVNLNEWLSEVANANVPTITIATKKDLLPYNTKFDKHCSVVNLENPGHEFLAENQVIYVNTQDVLSIAPGTSNYDDLNDFFKHVLGRRTG